ncbi:MAG: peptidoglycan-binding protein [Candidatus Marinimicrobia bacterium]|nr:peptidoglycan-binding protein [Candidatus Neomarinimicrobiota bacterium]
MALYKIGSKGDEVRKIQDRLKSLGFYRSSIDGMFGGGTDAAVKTYQSEKDLQVDGIVGPQTWKVLFEEEIQEPQIFKLDLDYKCLALTGSFETGKGIPDCFAGLSGDFDGQGMSFGVLQWNFGQNSLQPLLEDMINDYPDTIQAIFQSDFAVLMEVLAAEKDDLMTFVRSIQHPVKHYFYEPWKGRFKALGRMQEFQNIQVRCADGLYKAALRLCSDYELWSERAVALMFDIKVQNGNISRLVRSQIRSEIGNLPEDSEQVELEVEKMRIVANRRAEASNSRWVEDVRARKLCIANGKGFVHGIHLGLEEQFGISLDRTIDV